MRTWQKLCAGEYWLHKAQSDNDVLAMCGLVEGTYLPRRTSQRRLNHALALSLDASPSRHRPGSLMQLYTPFLSPSLSLSLSLLSSPDSFRGHSCHPRSHLNSTRCVVIRSERSRRPPQPTKTTPMRQHHRHPNSVRWAWSNGTCTMVSGLVAGGSERDICPSPFC